VGVSESRAASKETRSLASCDRLDAKKKKVRIPGEGKKRSEKKSRRCLFSRRAERLGSEREGGDSDDL